VTLHRFAAPFAISLSLAAAPAGAADMPAEKPAAEHGTPVRPNAGFDLMKSLVGEWEMPGENGNPGTTVIFSLVSSGTALMETMGMGGQKDAMVTVYHPDGEKLLMTHYCAANNQPRMRCSKPSADQRTLAFDFLDGANMSSSTGHMHRLVLTIEDADHLTEEWTWKDGKTSGTEVFRFSRKDRTELGSSELTR
jgi:hypothetical protein